MFKRLKQSLSRSHKALMNGLGNLFLGKKEIDAELLDELEMILIGADMGTHTVKKIMDTLIDQVSRKMLKNPEALLSTLETILIELLLPFEQSFTSKTLHEKHVGKPLSILLIGINGAGKTTTIGKLAKRFQSEHQKIILAAGDTFRAAAVHQLQVWGERNHIPVIAQEHKGADSAAVIYDAFHSAKTKNLDILLADTAGRLHTQQHLLEELKKVKRVISKLESTAPHEVILVLDASIGQNALNQAKQFHDALGITGIIMTKLDGTAKGGVIFAVADLLKLPIYFIGTGESIDDLEPFDAKEFVKTLLER